jgi:hypothetical protein
MEIDRWRELAGWMQCGVSRLILYTHLQARALLMTEQVRVDRVQGYLYLHVGLFAHGSIGGSSAPAGQMVVSCRVVESPCTYVHCWCLWYERCTYRCGTGQSVVRWPRNGLWRNLELAIGPSPPCAWLDASAFRNAVMCLTASVNKARSAACVHHACARGRKT